MMKKLATIALSALIYVCAVHAREITEPVISRSSIVKKTDLYTRVFDGLTEAETELPGTLMDLENMVKQQGITAATDDYINAYLFKLLSRFNVRILENEKDELLPTMRTMIENNELETIEETVHAKGE